MRDIISVLETIRRPRLLMQAARHALLAARRTPGPMAPARADLTRLISEEGALEQTRLAGDADYSVARHVELLAALIAEASRLPRVVN
ncbi:MAG: DUF6477 family protein [Rhodobacteraceae bacterium]|jgi:Family of unknown function (DUF6477)|nr:DUF6477 family protein [Paracoccaceae bacterium]